MIFVTGDTHGDYDIHKLATRNFSAGNGLSRDDYLVICGDFGFPWAWDATDKHWLEWLEAKPWTTLFIDGNHENHDLLDSFEKCEMFGGLVAPVPGYPDVIHLLRGEVYDIPLDTATESTARCFCFGGAALHDKKWRVEGESWFAREMPSAEEFERGRANLERVDWGVDYVFSHDCPASLKHYALAYDEERYRKTANVFDELEEYLDELSDKLNKEQLKAWYFGHYHADMVCKEKPFALLYNQVLKLGDFPE